MKVLRMQLNVTLLFLILFIFSCTSQKKDELKEIDIMNSKAFELRFSNPISAINISEQVLKKSKKINPNYKEGLARAYNNLAFIYFFDMRLDKAEMMIDSANKIKDYSSEKIENAISRICKAKICQSKGEFYEAYKIYLLYEKNEKFYLPKVKQKDSLFFWTEAEYYISRAICEYYFNQNAEGYNKAIEFLIMIDTNQLDVSEKLYTYYALAENYIDLYFHSKKDSDFICSWNYYLKGLNNDNIAEYIYFLANNYEGIGNVFTKVEDKNILLKHIDELKTTLQILGWESNTISIDNPHLPLLFYVKSWDLFSNIDNKFQLAVLAYYQGTFFLRNNNLEAYRILIDVDPCILSYSPIWLARLYHSLSLADNDITKRLEWDKKRSDIQDGILKKQNDKFRAAQDDMDRKDKESKDKQSNFIKFFGIILLLVLLSAIFFAYRKKHKKVLALRDMSNFYSFINSFTRNFKIEFIHDKKSEFIGKIYFELIKLNCIKKLPDFIIELYTYNSEKNKLESTNNENETCYFDLTSTEFPVVGCFRDTKEIIEGKGISDFDIFFNMYSFNDWNEDYGKYCNEKKVEKKLPYQSNGQIQSLIFIPLINVITKEVLGLLSFNTTQKNIFTEKAKDKIFQRMFYLVKEKVYYTINISSKLLEKRYSALSKATRVAHYDIIFQNNSLSDNMKHLVKSIRFYFRSEYCGIGKVFQNNNQLEYYDFVSDFNSENIDNCIVSSLPRYQNDFVKESFEKHKDYVVLYGKNIIQDQNQKKTNKNISYFEQNIIKSGKIENITILKSTKFTSDKTEGYIQLINPKNPIDIDNTITKRLIDLLSLFDYWEKMKIQADTERINKIDLTNSFSVDDILYNDIMPYLAQELNASVISLLIPLYYKGNSKYYLRKIFVSDDINQKNEIEKLYYREKEILPSERVVEHNDITKCNFHKNKKIYFTIKESHSLNKFEIEGKLSDTCIIIPILRDANKRLCNNNTCIGKNCKKEDTKFENIIGFFKLILEKDYLHEKRTKERIENLSNQLSILFKSIQEMHNSKHYEEFVKELKEIDIDLMQEKLDSKIAHLLKNSIGAKTCSIYRYFELVHPFIEMKSLYLSSTTAQKVYDFDNRMVKDTDNLNFYSILNSENIYSEVYNKKHTHYFYSIKKVFEENYNLPYIELPNDINLISPSLKEEILKESCLFFPIFNRDRVCVGVVAFIGKDNNSQLVSTSFTHHDIGFINFFINIIERFFYIKDADLEKEKTMHQIMHELKHPIIHIVPQNEGILEKYKERREKVNSSDLSFNKLYDRIEDNYNYSKLFKCIIDDVSTINDPIDLKTERIFEANKFLKQIVRLVKANDEGYPNEAKKKRIKIVSRTDDLVYLDADRDRIMQVFINILNNAIQYSNEQSNIYIDYSKIISEKKWHQITFTNYGIEIGEDEVEKIFEYKYRNIKAESSRPTGTGIGLYIVKKIMKAHGGDCKVINRHDPTQIAIILPDKK